MKRMWQRLAKNENSMRVLHSQEINTRSSIVLRSILTHVCFNLCFFIVIYIILLVVVWSESEVMGLILFNFASSFFRMPASLASRSLFCFFKIRSVTYIIHIERCRQDSLKSSFRYICHFTLPWFLQFGIWICFTLPHCNDCICC